MMRKTQMILVVTLILFCVGLMVAFSKTQSRVTQLPQTTARSPEQQLLLERTTSTQRQFNRYFQKDVAPKLKDCWARIKGQGSVEIQYTYRKDATGKWKADHLGVARSTLPRGQETVAVQCMEGSVRGSDLPAESSESTYTLYWSWSVPLPSRFPQAATEISAGSGVGGGCDGNGSPPHCWKCARGGCRPSCFGGEACRVILPNCRIVGDCGTGGIFGVAGEAVMQ